MPETISRISKLLIDRDAAAASEVLRRRAFAVTLHVGGDVASSRGLQLALLTAARIARRCFPGAVRVDAAAETLAAPALVGARREVTLGRALAQIVGKSPSTPAPENAHGLVFGNAVTTGRAHRVTYDGWIGVTGLATELERQAERDHCSLAPVLAAGLAMSELFLKFAEVDLRAGRRTLGLSLWRPDLDHRHPDALGVPVEALPERAWVLGLGHLGNAYLWSLATLPYADPLDVTFYLVDFDSVEKANTETGVLFDRTTVGHLKTRACAAWLEGLRFQTRLIERALDRSFRRRDEEPTLAFSGFDNNETRQALPDAGFGRVIDSGLGGFASNFDAIGFHSWPNPRTATDIWPVELAEDQALNAERRRLAATTNGAYLKLGNDECGRIDLAGKSVAVPFVGIVASTLVVAEALRMLNEGPKIENLKLRLGSLTNGIPTQVTAYKPTDLIGMGFAHVAKQAG